MRRSTAQLLALGVAVGLSLSGWLCAAAASQVHARHELGAEVRR